MKSMTYSFDELPLIEGAAVYAYGYAEMAYRLAPAEPDVGINEEYVCELDIREIYLEPHTSNGDAIEVKADTPLYKLIADAIARREDSVTSACIADHYNYED